MTNGSAQAGDLDQFVVAARSAAAAGDLTTFEEALKDIPNAAILTRGGRPDQPHLVVTLTADSAEKLKSRFGASLIIERNAKLTPF
jgi:hypothetical protein